MSLYRLSVKVGKPSSGRAHFDYITGDGKYKRIGTDDDIQKSESFNMPTWANNERDFWKEEEKRGDGYRKIELALPREYNDELNDMLVKNFIRQNLANYPCTYAIHKSKDGNNPHAHIMFSERKIDWEREEPDRENYFKRGGKRKDGTRTGGYPKDREITGKKRKEWLLQIRENWEQIQNSEFDIDGTHKVSAKSLKDQGIDREPQIHVGSKGWRLREKSERWLHNQAIIERNIANKDLKVLNTELDILNTRISNLEHNVQKDTAFYESLLSQKREYQKNAENRLREQKSLEGLSNYTKMPKEPPAANLPLYLSNDDKDPNADINHISFELVKKQQIEDQRKEHLQKIEDRIFELAKSDPSNAKGQMLAFYHGAIREKTSQFSSTTRLVEFSGIVKNSLISNKQAVGATLNGNWRKVRAFDQFDCTLKELESIVAKVNQRNGYAGQVKIIDDRPKSVDLKQTKERER